MKVLGFTNRDVERKLGLSGSYLSRLFSGLIELRVEHIVDIAKIIGVEPAELFQIAFPRKGKPSNVAAARLREVILGSQANAGENAEGSEDTSTELERALEKMMARSLQKVLGRMG
jgi:transcriptional regulator with XRE-family HTH domain